MSNVLAKHKELDKARLVLWDMYGDAETEQERNLILDAMDLICERMIQIELSWDWQVMLMEREAKEE